MENELPKLPKPRIESRLKIESILSDNKIKLEDLYNDLWLSHKKEIEDRLRYACYHLIPCPLKGKPMLHKMKWRGLYLKYNQYDSPYAFPKLCIAPSKSGKRKAFEIDLNFDSETLHAMYFLKMKEEMIAFGVKTKINNNGIMEYRNGAGIN